MITMKKIFTLLFVLCISYSLQAQLWIDQRADELFASGDYSYALNLYKKIKSKKQKDKVNTQIGRCYLALKDYAKAEEFLSNVEKTEKSGYEYGLRDLGIALLYQGKYEEAETAFRRFQETGFNDPLMAVYFQQCDTGKKRPRPDGRIRFVKTTFQAGGFYLGSTYVNDQWLYTLSLPKSNFMQQFDYPAYGLSAGKWSGHELKTDSVFQRNFTRFYLSSPSYDQASGLLYYSRNVSDVKISKKKKLTKHHLPADKVNRLQIFSVKYGQSLTEETEFTHNDASFNTSHPCIWNNGNAMLFASDRPGGFGGYDLYVSYKDGAGWTNPINLGNQINSIGDDMFPTVWGDSVLFFSSNGRPGLGGADIYRCIIFDGKFQTPEHLGPGFNTSYDDFGLWMIDKRHGYFATNRSSTPGTDEVYAFELPEQCFEGRGLIMDKLTLKPMKNVDVKIYQGDSLLATVKTDEQGFYFYPCFYIDMEYEIIPEEPKFRADTMYVVPRVTKLKELNMYMTPIVERNMVFTFNDILFEYNKADLLPESKLILDRLADLLKESGAKVELSAHTDSRGNDSYNQRLSQKRADSCINYLMSQGIPKSRLLGVGYGETRIKNRCTNGVICTEDEHTENRRVEIKVLDVR